MTRPSLSLSEEAYRILEEKIVTLELAPNQIVTEQELARIANFGRTPVREALQRLNNDMLIQVLPRRGILIEPMDVTRALMALDIRARLEPLIMERAARLSDEVDRMRFRQLADQIEASATEGEALAFTRLDRKFNDLAMHCARHELAARVVHPLHAIWRRIGYFNAARHPDRLDPMAQPHADLSRAIADNDQPSVAKKICDLLEAGRNVVLEIEGHGNDRTAKLQEHDRNASERTEP